MGRIHIDFSGRTMDCHANVGGCPYSEHYDSMDQYHAAMESKHGLLSSHSKGRTMGAIGEGEKAVITGANNLRLRQAEMLSRICSNDDLIEMGILLPKSQSDSVFTMGARERARKRVSEQREELQSVEDRLRTQTPTLAHGLSIDENTAQRYARMSATGRLYIQEAIHNATTFMQGGSSLAGQKDLGEIMEQVEAANKNAMPHTPAGQWMKDATYADMKDACSAMLSKGTVTQEELDSMSGEQLMKRLEQHMSGVPSVVKAQPMKRNIPPVANPDTYTAEEFVDALESEREKPTMRTEQRRAPGIAGAMGVLKAVRIQEPNAREQALAEYRRTLPPTQQDLLNAMIEAKSIGASQGVIDQINNAYKHEKAMGYNRAWDEALQEQRDRDQLIINRLRESGVSIQGDDPQQSSMESAPAMKLSPTSPTPDPRENAWRSAMNENREGEHVEVSHNRRVNDSNSVRRYLDGGR